MPVSILNSWTVCVIAALVCSTSLLKNTVVYVERPLASESEWFLAPALLPVWMKRESYSISVSILSPIKLWLGQNTWFSSWCSGEGIHEDHEMLNLEMSYAVNEPRCSQPQ